MKRARMMLWIAALLLAGVSDPSFAGQSLTTLTGTDCPQATPLPPNCYKYVQDFNSPQSANLDDRFSSYIYDYTIGNDGDSHAGYRRVTLHTNNTNHCDTNQAYAFASHDGCLYILQSLFIGNQNGTGGDSSLRCIACDMGFSDGKVDLRGATVEFDIRCTGCTSKTGRFGLWVQSAVSPYANINSTGFSNWMQWAGNITDAPWWNGALNTAGDNVWIHVTRTLDDRDDCANSCTYRWQWGFMDWTTGYSQYGYDALTRVLQYMNGDIILGYFYRTATESDIYGAVVDIDNISITFRHY